MMKNRKNKLLSIKSVMLALGLFVFGASAEATPISVSFSTTSISQITFHGDSFTESGQSGNLSLDSTSGTTTTNQVNLATMNVGWSNGIVASEPVSLNFDLTLDGVTRTLLQTATWYIGLTQDQLVAVTGSNDVLFATGLGSWLVHLDAFTITANVLGNFSSVVNADFTTVPKPGTVPEPATLGLLTLGLAGLGFSRRKKA